MSNCDMCGKKVEQSYLIKVDVEGSVLDACENCAAFGKILQMPKISQKQKMPQLRPKQSRKEVIQSIVSNYGSLIRNAREKLNLTQEEFAKKIAEKESLLQKIESNSFKPSLSLARKLETLLKITLVEQFDDSGQEMNTLSADSTRMTIADFIK